MSLIELPRKLFKFSRRKILSSENTWKKMAGQISFADPKAEKNIHEIHEYWKNPSENNLPEKYIDPKGGNIRSKMLLRLIKENTDLTNSSSIMELGCNVGRNLNLLIEDGFQNVRGIEINSHAVKTMQKIYPQLGKYGKITIDSLENALKRCPSNHFDLVFTMAVLEHIHKDSEWLFSEIKRITKKNIITIEDEETISDRHFPRNYGDIFEKLDMKQTLCYDCREISHWKGKFYARVFEKNE